MDVLRRQSQARVNRPALLSLGLAVCAGVMLPIVFMLIVALITDQFGGFLALGVIIMLGIGLIGSLAGVAAAVLLPIGKIGRAIAGGLVAFVTTLALCSLPSLIVDIRPAAFVGLAVLCTLMVTEWLRTRAVKPEVIDGDALRRQSQARVNRPALLSLGLAICAGAMGAVVYLVIFLLVTGDGIGFRALDVMFMCGIGLIGSRAGVAAAVLLPIGRIGRAVAGGLVAFVTTLALRILPGLIVNMGLAASVGLAVLLALMVTEWLRTRALQPEET
jgi:hypothetical protein